MWCPGPCGRDLPPESFAPPERRCRYCERARKRLAYRAKYAADPEFRQAEIDRRVQARRTA